MQRLRCLADATDATGPSLCSHHSPAPWNIVSSMRARAGCLELGRQQEGRPRQGKGKGVHQPIELDLAHEVGRGHAVPDAVALHAAAHRGQVSNGISGVLRPAAAASIEAPGSLAWEGCETQQRTTLLHRVSLWFVVSMLVRLRLWRRHRRFSDGSDTSSRELRRKQAPRQAACADFQCARLAARSIMAAGVLGGTVENGMCHARRTAALQGVGAC